MVGVGERDGVFPRSFPSLPISQLHFQLLTLARNKSWEEAEAGVCNHGEPPPHPQLTHTVTRTVSFYRVFLDSSSPFLTPSLPLTFTQEDQAKSKAVTD